MRLTDNEFHTKENKERACYIQEPRLQQIYDKLFELEDIEEELGIDLIELIKCIRNEKGIWKKDFDGGLINTRCMLTCYFGKWQIYDKENIYELKDYGKTWALTKEELL